MTLDPNHPLWEHCRDRDEAQLADLRRFERADLDARRRELEDRDACESVEAEETFWAGIFAQQPSWMKAIIYEGDRG